MASKAPPPGVDPGTGEITGDYEAVQRLPFAAFLAATDQGRPHAEASEALAAVVAAVQGCGKKGTVTIQVVVEPLSRTDVSRLKVSTRVVTKAPQSEPMPDQLWVDKHGNLVRSDPNQPELEGLQVVRPAPVKEVAR